MCIQDIFNPNQKKKLKGNKLVDNSKNLNSVIITLQCIMCEFWTVLHITVGMLNKHHRALALAT